MTPTDRQRAAEALSLLMCPEPCRSDSHFPCPPEAHQYDHQPTRLECADCRKVILRANRHHEAARLAEEFRVSTNRMWVGLHLDDLLRAVLVEDCGSCGGRGKMRIAMQRQPCPTCNGRGRV